MIGQLVRCDELVAVTSSLLKLSWGTSRSTFPTSIFQRLELKYMIGQLVHCDELVDVTSSWFQGSVK